MEEQVGGWPKAPWQPRSCAGTSGGRGCDGCGDPWPALRRELFCSRLGAQGASDLNRKTHQLSDKDSARVDSEDHVDLFLSSMHLVSCRVSRPTNGGMSALVGATNTKRLECHIDDGHTRHHHPPPRRSILPLGQKPPKRRMRIASSLSSSPCPPASAGGALSPCIANASSCPRGPDTSACGAPPPNTRTVSARARSHRATLSAPACASCAKGGTSTSSSNRSKVESPCAVPPPTSRPSAPCNRAPKAEAVAMAMKLTSNPLSKAELTTASVCTGTRPHKPRQRANPPNRVGLSTSAASP